MKNYVFCGGILKYNYAYIDLNVDKDYIADSLFYKNKIHVSFKNEYSRDGDKYRIIFCKIRKKDKEKFETALEEIKNKMNLFGHTDYEEWCDKFMKELGCNETV